MREFVSFQGDLPVEEEAEERYLAPAKVNSQPLRQLSLILLVSLTHTQFTLMLFEL